MNLTPYIEFTRKVPEEWEYFQEYVRRFPRNKPEERYGILIMGSKPCDENMLYASGPMELRNKHIDHLRAHPELLEGSIAAFVHFLQWLEGVEGKKPQIHKSAKFSL